MLSDKAEKKPCVAVLAEFSLAVVDGLDLWVWPGVQKISSELPTMTHFI